MPTSDLGLPSDFGASDFGFLSGLRISDFGFQGCGVCPFPHQRGFKAALPCAYNLAFAGCGSGLFSGGLSMSQAIRVESRDTSAVLDPAPVSFQEFLAWPGENQHLWPSANG
jgi:hypothetical protein